VLAPPLPPSITFTRPPPLTAIAHQRAHLVAAFSRCSRPQYRLPLALVFAPANRKKL